MRFAALIIASLLVGGCSKYLPKLDEVLPDRTKEYRKSESLPDLEVPPDLTADAINDSMAVPDVNAAGVATYSSYQERVTARKEARRIEENPLTIQTLDNEKVLIVNGLPSVVWYDLQDFWQSNGFELELNDQELGIMETGWRNNAQNLSRDRFKIFLEPGTQDGTSVLYVSHSGEDMQPVGENLVWTKRARDPATEDAMLARLSRALGGASSSSQSTTRSSSRTIRPASTTSQSRSVPQKTASRTAISDDDGFKAPVSPGTSAGSYTPGVPATASTAQLPSTTSGSSQAEVVNAGGGKYYINVPQNFSHAWTSTQQALERTSLIVEEGDRDLGVFYVTYSETGEKKKSVWKKMAFWSKDDEDKYQVSLTGVGPKTEIVILDAEGKWDSSDIANSILKELSSQLNW
jgi:outer membrane protein assembly factor BamC